MSAVRALRVIPHAAPWDWRLRLKTSAAVFGAIWIALEPRFAFAPIPVGEPVVAYAAMVLVSVGAAAGAEWIARHRRIGIGRRLRFYVLLTKAGRQVAVETVQDLTAREFVDALLHAVTRESGLSCYHPQVISLYENNLLVNRDGRFMPVEGSSTLREAGVVDGETCKIGGYVRVEYVFATLNIADSHRCHEMDEARRSGSVVLDEDGAVSIESFDGPSGARAKLWIIDNGTARGSAETHVTVQRVREALHQAGYRRVPVQPAR